ncbi:MAG: retropepsin-like aspartic protease [Flavobacterium sp.]|uniref:retropepsin-like aspartic protease n=1 Tax=Flavobacterium sp. TaxID=239 RepID=UPI003264313D
MIKVICRIVIFLTFFLASLNLFAQTGKQEFNNISQLLEQDNFFKAKEIYTRSKKYLTTSNCLYIEACLYNAFNKLEDSNLKINVLLKTNSNELNDSIKLKLYTLKHDNALKLYDYREGKKALQTIFEEYQNILNKETIEEYNNDLKICTALQYQPKQKVIIPSINELKIVKDKAGLDNIAISRDTDTLNFIFDTGANISTISKSVAERLKMKIIPADIEVGTITGIKVKAQLAICDKFLIGTIEICNAIFLVMDDNSLAFPQIDYQICGIIGYPVLEALKEIQITQEGYFIVPKNETEFTGEQNLAMDGLTPLISIEGKHYTFDSGASSTILYKKYYENNKHEFDQYYKPQKVIFGGAGGNEEFNGFLIKEAFTISGKRIILKDVQLLSQNIKEKETVFGNIGQDIIKQFSKMTINFNKMFIKFE